MINNPSNLTLQPYRKHIIMCTGKSCEVAERSENLYQYLKKRLQELGVHEGPGRIARSKSSCLGVCAEGTLAVVYPEGVWYHRLDQEKVERIIKEHLVDGNPVEEFMFHHQFMNGQPR